MLLLEMGKVRPTNWFEPCSSGISRHQQASADCMMALIPFSLLLHLQVLFEPATLQPALMMASPQTLGPQPPLLGIPVPLVCLLPPLPLPVPSYQLHGQTTVLQTLHRLMTLHGPRKQWIGTKVASLWLCLHCMSKIARLMVPNETKLSH